MMLLEKIEDIFQLVVGYGILLVELAGVVVMVIAAVKGMLGYINHRPRMQLELAQGISLALEFKLCGEVLRTVIVRDMNELFTVGAIFLLRAAMTFLVHWEIKKEEARMDELDEREKAAEARAADEAAVR